MTSSHRGAESTTPRGAARGARVAAAFAAMCVVVACGSSSNAGLGGRASDASAGSGGAGINAGGASASGGASAAGAGGVKAMSTGGSTAAPTPVTCAGATCHAVDTGGVDSMPCCTPANVCGTQLVLSTTCLPPNQPGGANPACADFSIAGKITMPGCCGPKGCGALATFGNLGCIPNADLGVATAPCTPSLTPPADGGADGASP